MKILGYDYTVTNADDYASMGAMGRSHINSLTIQIASDLNQQQTVSTLLHEMIEVINSHLHLQLSEQQIMAMEASLYQCLRDNGVSLTPLLTAAGINDSHL